MSVVIINPGFISYIGILYIYNLVWLPRTEGLKVILPSPYKKLLLRGTFHGFIIIQPSLGQRESLTGYLCTLTTQLSFFVLS